MSNVIHKTGDVWNENDRLWIKHDKGRQRYHRYLMEQNIGRKLLTKEIVHHNDGNRLNNDLGNLQIMSQSEHFRLHQTGNHNKRRSNGPHSEEWKEKIRQGNLGLKRSKETRLRMSEAKKGCTLSEEHKKNISVAGKKRYKNIETRKKTSEAITEWWRLRKERGA